MRSIELNGQGSAIGVFALPHTRALPQRVIHD